MNKLKSLVIGFGSIGKRHAGLQRELGIDVSLVTKQQVSDYKCYSSISDALLDFRPDFVLIANETSKHLASLLELEENNFLGKVLCEKPINSESFSSSILRNIEKNILVTYNLRFHPLIIKIKSILKSEQVISFNSYVGQYLPDWRPGTNYAEGYSAKKELGGGVLRDLSHEIDYSILLFGKPQATHVVARKVSDLNINTEDVAQVGWISSNGALGNITLNYLDHKVSRFSIINTLKNTYKIDFSSNELWTNNQVEKVEAERNTTYLNMYRAFLQNDYSDFCNLEQALWSLEIIEKAKATF